MKRIPFRIIIYILEFHALDLNSKYSRNKPEYICLMNDQIPTINNCKFKINKLFGYFKLDKFRKIFKLYNYLSYDILNDDIEASIFVSIKFQPSFIGCMMYYMSSIYGYGKSVSQRLFDTMTNTPSLKWMYVLNTNYSMIWHTGKRLSKKQSNIIKLKLMRYDDNINIINYPKLKYLYVNCLSDEDKVNLIGFKNWKGILKTDTPKYINIT